MELLSHLSLQATQIQSLSTPLLLRMELVMTTMTNLRSAMAFCVFLPHPITKSSQNIRSVFVQLIKMANFLSMYWFSQ
ncbi:hypothetical protein KR49_00095 [Synechococcus sp. KORDI-49]|nr:hypothetical protein KR49_00095 [Synechococcus sp. KORDI-49]